LSVQVELSGLHSVLKLVQTASKISTSNKKLRSERGGIGYVSLTLSEECVAFSR
jgi:hypothetical protein